MYNYITIKTNKNMTKEQMIKSLQEIDNAEKLLMRSLDDWEEDYISNKGYDSFVKEKLGMDGDDVETLTKIRKAVSNYCTKAIDSSTSKLRLGANFMDNDIDEADYEDRNRDNLILECVDKKTSQRAIDTLQTIVNCLHDGIDNLDAYYRSKGWYPETLKNDFVLDESQFNDMVNIEKAADDCKEENTEENTSDSLFPESFKPWLKYITGNEVTKIIDKYEDSPSDISEKETLEKIMDEIKKCVIVKLANDLLNHKFGEIEDKEIRDEVINEMCIIGKHKYISSVNGPIIRVYDRRF